MILKETVEQAKTASYEMARLTEAQKNAILKDFARLMHESRTALLEANAEDLVLYKKNISDNVSGATQAMYQRLILNSDKITQLVRGVEDTIGLADPCNQILATRTLAKNLQLTQISTPIGLIAIIFESRPDVIPQVLSLMIKSGNACILKGGKEAAHTNRAFMNIVRAVTDLHSDLPKCWASLLETREEIQQILAFHNHIDLVIPRGSNSLIQSVMNNTKIPVMGHADGVCHVYVDDKFDIQKALDIILDAKTQYPAACNSVETILLHSKIAKSFLSTLVSKLKAENVQIFGCEKTREIILDAAPVADWHTEYGDLRVAICIVKDIEAAVLHINNHGSHHSDAIVSTHAESLEIFKSRVDSASVMLNASTRFADGFRYGMGAEVGISTNKTHARGPVGLQGLVIYKYILEGDGHVVSQFK